MNQIQQNYATAKALYLTCYEEYQERTRDYDRRYLSGEPTDAEVDALVEAESAVDKELGYSKTLILKAEAAKQLVDWFVDVMKQEAKKMGRDHEVEDWEALRRPPTWELWEKIIDLAMRLEV